MPGDLVLAVGPFEIQLGMMKADVGAQQVGGHVGDDAVGELPIGGVHAVGLFQAAHNGPVGGMAGGHVQHVVRFGQRAGAFDPIRGDAVDFVDDVFGDQAFGDQVTVAKIGLALGLGQDARGMAQDVFRGHVRMLREQSGGHSIAAMKPDITASVDGWSTQRNTARMSRSWSIQIRLVPAPMAKKLVSGADGYCARSVFSHHR